MLQQNALLFQGQKLHSHASGYLGHAELWQGRALGYSVVQAEGTHTVQECVKIFKARVQYKCLSQRVSSTRLADTCRWAEGLLMASFLSLDSALSITTGASPDSTPWQRMSSHCRLQAWATEVGGCAATCMCNQLNPRPLTAQRPAHLTSHCTLRYQLC